MKGGVSMPLPDYVLTTEVRRDIIIIIPRKCGYSAYFADVVDIMPTATVKVQDE